MFGLYSPKYKYIAYISAKCGCTTIRKLFLKIHESEIDTNTFHPPYQLHLTRYYFPILQSNVKKFLLIRNPYLRVVSMYINKYVGHDSFLKNKLKSLNIPAFGNSFYQFLLLLQHLKSMNTLDIDVHIEEQSHKMDPDPQLQLIHLENINTELLSFYQLNYPQFVSEIQSLIMTPENNSQYQNNNEINDTNKIPYINYENPKQLFPNAKWFYNKMTQKLVYEIYKKDFELLGYSSNLPF